MSELNLKTVRINFNNKKVKYIVINNKLVWPVALVSPKVKCNNIVTDLSGQNSYLSFYVINSNNFDVMAQYSFILLPATMVTYELGANIRTEIRIPIRIGLNAYIFNFRFQKAISSTVYCSAFVAHMNYVADENVQAIVGPQYIITKRVFEVTATIKDNASLDNWILSDGLEEIERSGNTIKVKATKQSKELTISVKTK